MNFCWKNVQPSAFRHPDCLCRTGIPQSMKFGRKPLSEVQVCGWQMLNSQFRSSHLHRDADVSTTSGSAVSAVFVRIAEPVAQRGFRRNLLQGSDRALPELQFPGQGWSWVGPQKTEHRDHCQQGLPAGWLPFRALVPD